MRVLLDTNFLLRYRQQSSPAHLACSTAIERLDAQGFTVLDETSALRIWWRILVMKHGVSGKQAHDARIVAFMLALGVTHLLTLNPSDFNRYPEIAILEPKNV